MADDTKSGQARKGLIDAVKGKAKEVAGAVTGNDSLTAEGQLEQTQAADRREANAVEAVADAEATQARDEAAEARREATAERIAVNAEASGAEQTVDAQRLAEKRAAEQAGRQEVAVEATKAELDAEDDVEQAKLDEREDVRNAAGDFVDAVDQHQSSLDEAASAEAEADRARQRAEKLTTDADQP
jgi:uncharacterized protein YjbJ (UPF0337 family)